MILIAQQMPQPPELKQRTTANAATPEPSSPDSSNEPQNAVSLVSDKGLKLPHERDQSIDAPANAPDPVIAQAKRDIDAGLVDTDMRATPGLDAKLRAKLVPGAGGKPAGSRQ